MVAVGNSGGDKLGATGEGAGQGVDWSVLSDAGENDARETKELEPVAERKRLSPGVNYQVDTTCHLDKKRLIDELPSKDTDDDLIDLGDVIAKIDAADQQFWLMNTANAGQYVDQEKFPYILIDPLNDSSRGEDTGLVWVKPGSVLPIGCDTSYSEHFEFSPYVSRYHFQVSCDPEDGVVSIRDCGSTNGTVVEGVLKEETEEKARELEIEPTPSLQKEQPFPFNIENPSLHLDRQEGLRILESHGVTPDYDSYLTRAGDLLAVIGYTSRFGQHDFDQFFWLMNTKNLPSFQAAGIPYVITDPVLRDYSDERFDHARAGIRALRPGKTISIGSAAHGKEFVTNFERFESVPLEAYFYIKCREDGTINAYGNNFNGYGDFASSDFNMWATFMGVPRVSKEADNDGVSEFEKITKGIEVLEEIYNSVSSPLDDPEKLAKIMEAVAKAKARPYKKLLRAIGTEEKREVPYDEKERDKLVETCESSKNIKYNPGPEDFPWYSISTDDFNYSGVDYKFYINADADMIHKIARLLVEEYQEKEVSFALKYPHNAERVWHRADPFVLYSSKERVGDNLAVLRSVKEKHLELDAGIHTPHILAGEIDGWIGFGAEAKERWGQHGVSYNDVRAKLVRDAYWGGEMADFRRHGEKGTWTPPSLDKFRDNALMLCEDYKVDPTTFCFNNGELTDAPAYW